MTDQPRAPYLYIDANPFMYAVEGSDDIARPVKDLLEQLRAYPGAAVTSELTLAEVLPKAGPHHRRSYFELMLWSGIIILCPVTREILIETADYRRMTTTALSDGRKVMPKLPDAIHVVTAIRARCRKFLSMDWGIRTPADMTLVEATGAGIVSLIQELRDA